MTLREKAIAKRDIVRTLELHAEMLRVVHLAGPHYAPSSGRNADVRRCDDAMNERKVADALKLPPACLHLGRAHYRIFATPAAHETLAKALNKLPPRLFDSWRYAEKACTYDTEYRYDPL